MTANTETGQRGMCAAVNGINLYYGYMELAEAFAAAAWVALRF